MALSLGCDAGPWARVKGLGWWRRQESLPSCSCPWWHSRRKCIPVAPSGAGLWRLERMLCTHPGDSGTSHWDVGTEGEGVCVCWSPKAFEVSVVHSVREVEGTVVISRPDFPQGPRCLSGWVCWDVGEAAKELSCEAPFLPLPVSLPLSNPHSALSVLPTKAAASEQLRLQSSQNNKG